MNHKLTLYESNRPLELGEKIAALREEDALAFYNKFSSSFVARNCPACHSPLKLELKPFLNVYGVSKCRRCTLLFVDPCPLPSSLGHYYANSLSTKESNQLLEKRAQEAKKNPVDDRVAFVESFLQRNLGKKVFLLEVGCSTGSFIERCQVSLGDRYNFSIKGIDIDPRSIEVAKSKGLDVECANVEDFLHGHSQQYDLVVHFELLEHLVDPYSFMKNCFSLLNQQGEIYFSTPNYEGMDNKVVSYDCPKRLMAHAIFPPFHLSGFNPISVNFLLNSVGFLDVEVTTPGKLDMDLLRVHLKKMELPQPYLDLCQLDDSVLGLFQKTLAELGVSSHMHIKAKK